MCPVSLLIASCAVLELQPRTAADLQWLEDSQCQSLNDWVGVGHPYQALCQRNKVRCSIFMLVFIIFMFAKTDFSVLHLFCVLSKTLTHGGDT